MTRYRGYISCTVVTDAADYVAAQKQFQAKYGDNLDTNQRGDIIVDETDESEKGSTFPLPGDVWCIIYRQRNGVTAQTELVTADNPIIVKRYLEKQYNASPTWDGDGWAADLKRTPETPGALRGETLRAFPLDLKQL